MTSAQYQDEFNKRTRQGYRLINVSGYGVGANDHYAAIWERSTGASWTARHGMTSTEYQQEFQSRNKQGYRLANISGYNVDGQDLYAAIWEKTTGPPQEARHRMTAAQYQVEFTRLTKLGYRLVDISGYEISGQDHFAAIWEKKPGPPWEAHHSMSSSQYQAEINRLSKLGYHLAQISGWAVGETSHYAAIWEMGGNHEVTARQL